MSHFDSYMMELSEQEQEQVKFECFYWSVINDIAMLIKDNGYDVVLKDIIDTVDRISDKGVQ